MANAETFEEFLQGWMDRQRNYVSELVSAKQHLSSLTDDDKRDLINRVLGHYEQYFEEKSKIAHSNILLVFSPPWFSSLERSLLWVAGFVPRTAFNIVESSVLDLTEEQRQSLRELIYETKMKERDLNNEMAKVQEKVAAPPLLAMARSHGRRWSSSSYSGGEDLPDDFKVALENIVGSADALRTNTALRVIQILSPDQGVAFLASVGELQLRIRSLGLDKDAQSNVM